VTIKEEIEKGLKYFKEHHSELSSLYNKVFGEDICFSCNSSSVEYAFNKLYEKRNEEPQKIRMKRGRVINTHMWDESLGFEKKHYTFHNTSDELAKKFIDIGYQDYFIL
jgi:hypothetical protein